MLFGKLLPREGTFFELFNQHAGYIADGARAFTQLIRNYADLELREKHANEVGTIERQADRVTAEVNRLLHKTFITPIDRDQIHRLITRMDDIMDYVEAAAERIELYELTTMTADCRDLADALHRAAQQVEGAVRGLRTLKEPQATLKLCIDINRLENETDAILRRSVARLFKDEKDPILVIKWKEIYENLESAADRCEDVANIIEGVILEHS
jgi:predicted phosphate transport protein (TIGR00153 family)